MADREVGTAAVVRMDLDALLERSKGKVPPGLEPVGECPYCHHDLERRTAGRPPVLLVFWGCTNGECSLMFWRRPRTAPHSVFPLAHEDNEH